MAEFFIELLSEEIPARMQAGAADELARVCGAVLTDLKATGIQTFYGPRRIALTATVAAEKAGGVIEARGPRENAPEAALAGFLGKFKASRDELVTEGGFFLLRRNEAAVAAADLIAASLPTALAKFAWPKSMRWGQSGDFTWVRPLRRMICLLDGAVVSMTLGPVTASHETEGHRFMAPGAFSVTSAADWQAKLRTRKVIADQAERRALVVEGLNAVAAQAGLTVAEDAGLVDEVTGLVEWPVALLGKIDADFMDLPPEVRELSMKVNQRYFALRDAVGKPAPYFAFAANIEARDGGAAIIAGNERVLRARLSDARHFWDLDLKTPLNASLPKLEKITFHAKIGTQLQRSERIAALAEQIANALGANAPLGAAAKTAGLLCKADLVTGMVGEFPELQGIMGGYYAEHMAQGWDGSVVGPAIKTHYQPKGPSDAVPTGVVSVSVALADKLDTLIKFFEIGEKPTGSGDPYALRRAALGVIRIILENQLTLPLKAFITNGELFAFIIERLRVKLRSEGQRFDVLDAVLAAGDDDNLVRVMQRVNAVAAFLAIEDGANLLIAYRRAANILRIEDAKDGPHKAEPVLGPLPLAEEEQLRDMLPFLAGETVNDFRDGNFARAMAAFSKLRTLVDAFFDKVTVNDPVPQIRQNRLRLLAQLRDTMHQIADFSKIEG
ncbi:MAG: glycine--tRNA ligase subunit beta [Acidocella sp. 20-57-95]|nr:MAG: glycine--tRNA ligase subunit beta [Acidocella sp. 20-57-95]OYV61892.1 MAG: glycine--tRNA ligase subunit beta [Acidocella sp. 21-58-7]HQT64371.1 glycine--tRNA ligase subunit beta [Acidocella sp.]HQU03703.1 glycine--tRNA ligase subunit beta [Acidocella sp.]